MADYKNFERVLRNIDKLNSRALVMKPEFSADEMRSYLSSEGYSLDRFSKAANNYAKAQGLEAEYGLGRAGFQGLSLGFGDEFEAGVKTLINKKPYDQNIAAIQFAKQEFEAERPIAAAATEVFGSLPTAVLGGAGTAATLARVAPQTMRAGAAISPSLRALGTTTGGGAITGGLVGAGQAEEGNRLEGAKRGAQIAALVSPLALVGQKVVGGALTKTADATGLTDATQRIVEATKNTPAVSKITGKTAEFFGLTDDAIQRRADTKIIQALQRDKLTVQEVRSAMDTIRKSGYKPETIMEVGGESTKRLGETVASYPAGGSVAAKMVEERKAGAAERILTDFKAAFNANADPMDLADNLIATRTAASAPLYKAAFDKSGVIGGESIDRVMQDPAFVRAYERANRLALREVDEAGNVVGKALPDLLESGNAFDLKTINFIKRGIDAEINYSKLPTSGLEKTEVDSIKNLRTVFMRNVDEQAPKEYKQARDAFAGPSQVIDAIDSGRSFFDIDARQLRKTYDALGPSEKDGFSIGAYDAIRTKIQSGADGIDQVRRTFGSPEKRDQIRVLIGEDAFTTLESQLARERAIRTTDMKLTGGSQTQPRATAQAEFEGATELVPQIANKGLVRGATDYLLRSTSGTGSRTAEQLAPDLFSINPDVQANMLNRLLNLDEYLKQQSIRQGTTTGITGGVAGQSLLD